MRIAAIVAVRNGEPHIARCLTDLISNNIEVVVLDHGSEDATFKIAQGFLGRGLLWIDNLPWRGLFSLKNQLQAKSGIISRLTHDWVLHLDVDEWLCPPTPEQSLHDAIAQVDAAGYDCINFDEMVFAAWPGEEFRGHDYSRLMTTYYFFEPHKQRLMRAWKRSKSFSNINFGGHMLDGSPNISPQSFILRHYIALSGDAVFEKYATRVFDPAEVEIGWHHSEKIQRIGIRREQCDLKPSPFLKRLPSWDSSLFDKSRPATQHFWQWS
jgi:glycosyltransferase involved in cell wall biosynthesis